MSEKRRTVVPFERPAAYWATRARRHYAPSRLPDAARLMRKALEKSGDGNMALELSQIYGGMGCFTAAERALVKAVFQNGLTGGACYLIACCALNRDEEELGERALEMSLRLDPDGPYADQAQDMLEEYPWQDWNDPPRGARGRSLCFRARQALMENDPRRALALAQKAWARGKSPDAALLMGVLLNTPQASLPYLTYAAHHMPGRVKPHLLLALNYARAGRREDARRRLLLARLLCTSVSQAEQYCETAWQAGFPDLALDLCRALLAQSPASADYLRLKYLSLLHAGDEAGARRALATLLEIDPDDASALWYSRHPEDRRLFPGRLLHLGVLAARLGPPPERLRAGPLNRLLHLLVMALRDRVDTETIYRLAPPLWRRLSPAEKRACDDRTSPAPLAIALCLLLRTGQEEEARRLYAASPNKKRIGRLLRKLDAPKE